MTAHTTTPHAPSGWTVRTVDDAMLIPDAIRVQHSSLPAIPGIGLAELMEFHLAPDAESRAALSVGVAEPSPIGPAGSWIRRYDYLDSGAMQHGLTVYAELGSSLHWFSAESALEIEDSRLVAAVAPWVDRESSLDVTALELRVIGDLMGLEPVHFIAAEWYLDLPEGRREELALEVVASLARRGIIDADPTAPSPVLAWVADLVQPVLDGDTVIAVTRRIGPGTDSTVIGRYEDRWCTLRAGPWDDLIIAPVHSDPVATLLDVSGADRVAEPTTGDRSEAITTTASELREALSAVDREAAVAPGPASDSARWRAGVVVQAVRKAATGLEHVEVSWLEDENGAAWVMDGTPEQPILLTPIRSDALTGRLRGIVVGEAGGSES